MQGSLVRNPSAPPESPRKRRWFTGFKIVRLVETESPFESFVNEGVSYVSRSLASEGRGHRFESCRARQLNQSVKLDQARRAPRQGNA